MSQTYGALQTLSSEKGTNKQQGTISSEEDREIGKGVSDNELDNIGDFLFRHYLYFWEVLHGQVYLCDRFQHYFGS